MKVQIVDYSLPSAPKQFADSLRNTGFAVIKNHPLSTDQIKNSYKLWRDFFTSGNTIEKQKLLFSKVEALKGTNTQAGFFPVSATESAKGYDEKDLKEFYQYYDWGPLPELTRDITDKTYLDLNCLASELLGWLQDNTPEDICAKLHEPLPDMIKNSKSTMLRVIHYPPLQENEFSGTALRAAPHTDIVLLTVLPFSEQSGLEVMDRSGNWHEVPSDPGMICVNAGDMLDMATEGYYPSTLHRVTNPDVNNNVSRLSMPLFLHARADVRLSEKHTAASFLKERLVELGLAA